MSVANSQPYGEADLQFTIETRQLTNEQSRPFEQSSLADYTTVEAGSAGDAISAFVLGNASELVSLSSPGDGRESIATVRKADSVFLVRVYSE